MSFGHTKMKVLGSWMFAAILLTSCSVTPQRNREARLMPVEVAQKIIAKHTNPGWAQHPQARALLANEPMAMCYNKQMYDLDYREMTIVWDLVPDISPILSVSQRNADIGFLCGNGAGLTIKVKTKEELDDLIDAFISMGAKAKVSE
jgi:hypothetical protein